MIYIWKTLHFARTPTHFCGNWAALSNWKCCSEFWQFWQKNECRWLLSTKVRKITMPSFFPRKVTQALCLRHEVFSFANKTDQTIICWHLLVFHNKAINGPKSRMKSKWCLSEPSGFNLWPQVGEVKQKKRREIERYVVPLYYAAYFRPILDRKI